MKTLVLILAVLNLVGCSESPKQVAAPVQRASVAPSESVLIDNGASGLSEKSKIALLRKEAHERGLHWTIWCTEYLDRPDEQFMAVASPKSMPMFAVYAEDGAVAHWIAYGSTQGDAAGNLYEAIQNSPNMQPQEKEKQKKSKLMCPRDLSGE